MKAIQSALSIVQESRRAYVILNLFYYGLVVGGMVYTVFDRSVQQQLFDAVGNAFAQGPLATLTNAYTTGQTLQAIGLTFIVNLTVGSFMSITLPSLIIPFSGLLVGGYRAVLWGLLFSPPALNIGGREVVMGILIAVLLILEGQGYVLAMLAAYVQGKAFLFPRTVGVTGPRQAYLAYAAGVKRAIRLYVLVVLVLAIAAIYEASIAILVLPRLR